MIDAATVLLICGFIDFGCMYNRLSPRMPSETEKFCKVVENKPEWCKVQLPPLYPPLKKDRTQ